MKRWFTRLTAVLILISSLGFSAAGSFAAASPQWNAVEQDPHAVTVYITRTGEKYHRDGCRHLSRSRIPVSLKEAVANGFGPCRVCQGKWEQQ